MIRGVSRQRVADSWSRGIWQDPSDDDRHDKLDALSYTWHPLLDATYDYPSLSVRSSMRGITLVATQTLTLSSTQPVLPNRTLEIIRRRRSYRLPLTMMAMTVVVGRWEAGKGAYIQFLPFDEGK